MPSYGEEMEACRTYDTLDELWIGSGQLIEEQKEAKEQLGFVARLTDPTANFMFNPVRKMSPSLAAAKVIWYLSGESKVDRIAPYDPKYLGIVDKKGEVFGAYGDRWKEWNQLEILAKLLKDKPDTQYAVIAQWMPSDIPYAYRMDKKNLPSALTLNFSIKDDRLNLVANLCSSDIWDDLPNDIFCFCCLQQIIATTLQIGIGWYQHQVMVLSCQDQRLEDLKRAVNVDAFNVSRQSYKEFHQPSLFNEIIPEVLAIEEWNRLNKLCTAASKVSDENILGQLLVMASTRWTTAKQVLKRIINPILRKYIEERSNK